MAEQQESGNKALPELKSPPPTPSLMPREVQYVGPRPAPRIIIPGDRQPYRADNLTAAQRALVIASNPDAKGWWK